MTDEIRKAAEKIVRRHIPPPFVTDDDIDKVEESLQEFLRDRAAREKCDHEYSSVRTHPESREFVYQCNRCGELESVAPPDTLSDRLVRLAEKRNIKMRFTGSGDCVIESIHPFGVTELRVQEATPLAAVEAAEKELEKGNG
jgi:hypothetical protein